MRVSLHTCNITCVCERYSVYYTAMHPSGSPAIDIQMAPCEKLNREAVEVPALLFLSGRDTPPEWPLIW